MCLPLEIFCFCASLEVGTKVVAILHIVLSALVAIVYGSVTVIPSYLSPTRKTFYATAATTALVSMVQSCLMTYGAFTNKRRFLWAWVMMAWCLSVVLAAMAILGTVLLSFAENAESTSEITTMVSVYFVYAVFLYYSASIVNSRRLQLLREAENMATEQLLRMKENVPKSLSAYNDVV